MTEQPLFVVELGMTRAMIETCAAQGHLCGAQLRLVEKYDESGGDQLAVAVVQSGAHELVFSFDGSADMDDH